jgi:response regulator RpfG family c-di-GMP phosphodiesterase
MSLTAHILVVDDLDANRALIARMLAPDGYLVSGAADGAQALEMVAEQQPDLVLLDVMMPGTDGFAVCRTLKQEAATRLIPVVLITSLSESSSRIEGLDAGADDYVSKPVNAQELRARVRSLLRIKRYTDDLAQIIGIVDVFDALTTERPYKPALSLEDAARELAAEATRGWRDAKLVDVFVGMMCHDGARSVGG